MKTTKLFLLFTLFVTLLQSCTKDPESYNSVPLNTYYYLTAAQLNQTPYFTNKAFDTISFANDKGDTLTFVKTKTDTTWYIEVDNTNPNNPNKDADHFQTIHNTYTTIKGSGSFDVKHSKKNSLQNRDILEVSFGNYIFYTGDYAINDVTHPRYLGTITIKNKIFSQSMFTYNKFTDSLSAICKLNKDFGVFLIEDKINKLSFFNEK